MQKRTLRVLEFDKICEVLASYAASQMGKELCLALEPSVSRRQIDTWLAETEEAAVALTRLGYYPIASFADVRHPLQKAKIGAVLSAGELLACSESLRCARAIAQSLSGENAQTQMPLLCAHAARLGVYRNIEDEINRAILSEDEIADTASPELASIRRKIRQANDKVKEKLNAYLHGATSRYLQEPVITMRAGRYVLPVKQEYRGQVPGLIHDQSATGSTVFIEPMAVVELGNTVKQLQSQEQAEIERILAALTASLAPYSDDILNNLDVMAHLDFVFAKGELSRLYRCTMPKIQDKRSLKILRGRHPLIDAQKVVPITVWVGGDFTTLVVTGPNTGGNTVTLTTVGLFCLMAQAGLHVPADLGTTLCIFGDIFADIGDEQSIEQSLSTFSSHMVNIVSILENVTDDSLVLFDELGAGTDPTEGASLAQAILDTLLARKITTLATTHYSELKVYAMTTPGVTNASVEFDIETLRPTYRLSIGIPGKSNAFAISKRLGLSDGIIERAKEKLTTDQIRFEEVLSSAQYNRQVAEREREIAEEARKEITRLQNEIEKKRDQLANQEEAILKKAREEARRIVHAAKAESEQIITQLKKTQADQASIMRASQQARKTLDEQLSKNAEKIEASGAGTEPPKTVLPGQSVKVLSLGAVGTVLSKPNDRGQVQVQVGIMKTNVSLADLRLEKTEKKEKGKATAHVDMQARYVPLELDVRGYLLEEAIEAVDKYLDDAYLAARKEVSIIHGKGTGILRSGLQEHLKRHPHVVSFRMGKFGEGESGVTVVELK